MYKFKLRKLAFFVGYSFTCMLANEIKKILLKHTNAHKKHLLHANRWDKI